MPRFQSGGLQRQRVALSSTCIDVTIDHSFWLKLSHRRIHAQNGRWRSGCFGTLKVHYPPNIHCSQAIIRFGEPSGTGDLLIAKATVTNAFVRGSTPKAPLKCPQWVVSGH